MQALGLIETRGLIAAVESADAMLKAAEVTLLDKTYVGGGLVTVTVTGGVAAVKAAVEAGAAAVRQLGGTLLISQHVIPRPHEEIDILIVPKKYMEDIEIEVIVEELAEAEPDLMTLDFDKIDKAAIDGIKAAQGTKAALAVLGKLKVTKLRNLAREYKGLGIAGRLISKADKKTLLLELEAYYKKN